jgi:hypothetical protein
MVRGIAICAHFEPCQPSVAKRQDAALAIPADVVAWEHAYKFFSLPRHLDKEEETFHIKEAANKLIVLFESTVQDGEARKGLQER